MRFTRVLLCGLAVMLVLVSLPVSSEEPSTHCFRMHMTDDGKVVDAPERVTFIDGSDWEEVEAKDNRYCVPESMMGASTLDLRFDASGSRFSLFHVRIDLFDADWDIAFGNKRFAKLDRVAKTIKADEACSVRFGEDEAEAPITVPSCRLPVYHSQERDAPDERR